MKYTYLAAWAKEYALDHAVIERIYLGAAGLYIAMKDGRVLVLVLSARDSFIFYRDTAPEAKPGPELWPQIRNSKIYGCRIHSSDRIIEFHVDHNDMYGECKKYTLVMEFMPPKPNVILCKREGMIVVDAITKYSLSENPMRMVLPNQPYYPPKTSFQPEAISGSGFPLCDSQTASSANTYFALCYAKSLQDSDCNQALKSKMKHLQREMKKAIKRKEMQAQDLQNAEKAEYYRTCAEALKPVLKSIKAGQQMVRAVNYLSPDLEEIDIPLQADKSPLQNLNSYIKKYHKAKNGLEIIKVNMVKTEEEIARIKSLITRLESGEDLDLESGDNLQVMSQKVQLTDRILNLRLDDSWQIYIGRKAKENDYITTKLGKAQDWWFHCRIYRGAHVLLRNYRKQEPGADIIRLCSSLAAWYSSAKFSVNVPVDYTQVRYVRKPRGSAAGFVTYTNYKTCFANPLDIRAVRSELGL
ncbi:MAG: NFACT RNA binding domain-containing protein [Candidatus Cloacimonetes bacterium]|nr:NFACT RNA binding domain-containing protein [Candidatus Cloacimonadota bacterium]